MASVSTAPAGASLVSHMSISFKAFHILLQNILPWLQSWLSSRACLVFGSIGASKMMSPPALAALNIP